MRKRKTIFERLEEKGVKYGVGVAIRTFITDGIEGKSNDHFIFTSEENRKEVSSWSFVKGSIEGVIEREFVPEDFIDFKTIQKNFKRIEFAPFGTIYEHKTKPFKND